MTLKTLFAAASVCVAILSIAAVPAGSTYQGDEVLKPDPGHALSSPTPLDSAASEPDQRPVAETFSSRWEAAPSAPHPAEAAPSGPQNAPAAAPQAEESPISTTPAPLLAAKGPDLRKEQPHREARKNLPKKPMRLTRKAPAERKDSTQDRIRSAQGPDEVLAPVWPCHVDGVCDYVRRPASSVAQTTDQTLSFPPPIATQPPFGASSGPPPAPSTMGFGQVKP